MRTRFLRGCYAPKKHNLLNLRRNRLKPVHVFAFRKKPAVKVAGHRNDVRMRAGGTDLQYGHLIVIIIRDRVAGGGGKGNCIITVD